MRPGPGPGRLKTSDRRRLDFSRRVQASSAGGRHAEVRASIVTRADTMLAGDPQRGSFEDVGTYARAMAAKRSRRSGVVLRRKRRMDSVEHDLSDEQ